MTIDRSKFVPGGRALLRVRFSAGGGQAFKTRPVVIETVERAACKVRTVDDGRVRVVHVNELEVDVVWEAAQAELEASKKEMVRREGVVPVVATTKVQPVVRLVEDSRPLRAPLLAEALAKRDLVVEQKVKVHKPLAAAQYDAWLKQGDALRAQLDDELDDVLAEMTPLEEQLAALQTRRTELERRMRTLDAALIQQGGSPP